MNDLTQRWSFLDENELDSTDAFDHEVINEQGDKKRAVPGREPPFLVALKKNFA